MPGNDKPVKRSSPTAESDRPSSVLDYAQLYLANGISIIPIARTGTKLPAIRLLPKAWNPDTGKHQGEWNPFRLRFATEEELLRWFPQTNPCGIALVCGVGSGGLYVADFDNEGEVTFGRFRQLVQEDLPGVWERLAIVRTPGEGERHHVLWRCPDHDTQGNEELAKNPSAPKGKQRLIELKGDGGYVLAVGSPGKCHPSGRTYEHVAGPLPWNPPTLTFAEHEALLTFARSLTQEKPAAEQAGSTGTGLKPLDALDRSDVPWEDVLDGSGWVLVKTRGSIGYWRRPGSEHAWSATTGFCRGPNGESLLYVFSSNADPFACGKCYGKGRAFALLHHAGNWSAAASAIVAKWPELRNGRTTPRQSPGNNGQAADHSSERGAARPGGQAAPAGNGQVEDSEPGPTHEGNGQESEARSGTGTGSYHLTELGNALRLVERHGSNLRYVHEWGKWLIWDSVRWKIDAHEHVVRLMQATLNGLFNWTIEQLNTLRGLSQATDPEDKERREQIEKDMNPLHKAQKWSIKSESASILFNSVKLARFQAGVPVDPDALDRSKILLNCPNGTVDLHCGQSYPHRKEDMLTCLCPTMYNPDASCPTWLKALGDIFQGKQQLISYLQRLLGYCLTGDTREQVIFVWHGPGGNGKGLILDTIRDALGPDYYMQAQSDLFLARRGKKTNEEIARLRGKRLVACAETDQGARVDEALIKSLTGEDRLVGKKLYVDLFEFDPTHKLILSTNHRPTIRGTDTGIWRRVQLLPFEVRFLQPGAEEEENDIRGCVLRADTGLRDKLRAELPGILAWLVAGSLAWQREGLNPPPEVLAATREYRESEDIVGQFIEERCYRAPDAECRARELHSAFKQWAEANGFERALNPKQFAEALRERGVAKVKNSGFRYKGIGLRGPEDFADVES